MSNEFIPLSKLVVEKGLQTGPFGSQLKANEYTENGVPVIMPKDIYAGKVITKSIARTSVEKADKLKKHLVRQGDILFPRRGDLGRIAVIDSENSGWICGTGCLRARLKKGVCVSYIHQFVQLSQVVKWLESNALGQTMLNLNTEIIGELPIYLPELVAQEKIATLLNKWDTAIEKTEALIAAKERQFGWLRSKMINECQGESLKLQDLEKQNLIEMGRGNIISKKDIEAFPGENPIYSSSVKNDGLFGRYGNFMFDEELITWSVDGGGDFFLRKKHKFSVTNVCGFMKVNQGKINYGFLAAQLQEKHSKLKFDYQFKAHPSVIRNIYSVVVPCLEVQKHIAETLNTARHEINLLKKLAVQYRTQKRGLMQKLLTGEWRIKTKEVA